MALRATYNNDRGGTTVGFKPFSSRRSKNRIHRATQPLNLIEPLESRRLLASAGVTAVLTGSVLTVTGRPKDDLITITEASSNITVTLGTGNDTKDLKSFTSSTVKSIVVNGGSGDDVIVLALTTTSTAVTVTGGAGNDTITGSGGAESLVGNAGNDSIIGAAGNDTIAGNEGNDTIDAGTGDDVVSGSSGDDSMLGGDGNDTISGSAGMDTIDGGGGNDSIAGGGDNDWLLGGGGNDSIDGSSGNDFIDGGAGGDSLLGGEGVDTIDGSTGNDTVRAGNGRDITDGGAGKDTQYTESRDTAQNFEISSKAFVTQELPDAGLTTAPATVDPLTGKHVTVTLNFSKVAADTLVSAKWVKHKGNTFTIIADVQKYAGNAAPTAVARTLTVSLGVQPPGAIRIIVYSATGLTSVVTNYTVPAWIVPTG
jgi:Ca2+-binding RTX toxin-like protein